VENSYTQNASEGRIHKVAEEHIADKEDRTVGGTEAAAGDTEAVGHNMGSAANDIDTDSTYSGSVAVHLVAVHSTVVHSRLVVGMH